MSTAPIRYLFTKALKRLAPPWLRRRVGGALMEAFGDPIETLVDRTSDSVKLRFPDGAKPDALGYLGRERRILRGPGEDSVTYASRLLKWWDSHLLRGGPYALLEQMHAFFLATMNVQIDLAGNGRAVGTPPFHSVDSNGVITRGSIVWDGDGTDKWARIFIFFRLPTPYIATAILTTESGEPILTEGGEEIIVETSIYSLTDEDKSILCAVPHEWSAAHIDRIYITLLHGTGDLWGYPVGGIWDENDPAPGPNTWGGDMAVQFIC